MTRVATSDTESEQALRGRCSASASEAEDATDATFSAPLTLRLAELALPPARSVIERSSNAVRRRGTRAPSCPREGGTPVGTSGPRLNQQSWPVGGSSTVAGCAVRISSGLKRRKTHA